MRSFLSGSERRLLILVTLAGAALRLAYQFDREFRGDEVGTLIHMDRPLFDLLTHSGTWLTMNYFIAAEKLIGWLFGRGPLALGMLSLAAGVALIPLTAHLARRITSARASLIAAALVAANPFLVDYSCRIRAYSLLAGLSVALLISYLSWRDRPTTSRGVAVAVVTTLLLLSHPGGLYPVVFLGLSVLAGATWEDRRLRTARLRTLVMPILGAACLVALAYAGLFRPLLEEGRQWHITPPSSFEYFPYLLSGYFGEGALGLLFGVPLLLGVWVALRTREGGWLVAFLLVPSLLMSAQGLAHRPWAYQRLLIFLLPALLLVVALGIDLLGFRRRLPALLIMGGLLACWAPGLQTLFSNKPRLSDSPLLTAAEFVKARYQQGDLLLCLDRRSLLHLQNHLPPSRFEGRTLEQYLGASREESRAVFFFCPAPIATAQPSVPTSAGRMIQYPKSDRNELARTIRRELAAPLEGLEPSRDLSDGYGILCRIDRFVDPEAASSFCDLFEETRVVTRRERVERIGPLFR